MRYLLIIVLTFAALGAQAETDSRHILVEGSGWVEATPDMLSLSLSLLATGEDVEKLQQSVEKTAQQVQAAARDNGVAAEDVDSSRASVRPEFEWRDGQRIYRGQTVQRDIVLVLRDLDRYGALLMALSRLDIHSLGQPQPGHSQLANLQLEAIDAALANAAAKAARIAATLEVELGRVISAEEQLDARSVAPGAKMMAMESGGAPDIQFGKQRISARMVLRYAIAD